jgi:hypothetical protein
VLHERGFERAAVVAVVGFEKPTLKVGQPFEKVRNSAQRHGNTISYHALVGRAESTQTGNCDLAAFPFAQARFLLSKLRALGCVHTPT